MDSCPEAHLLGGGDWAGPVRRVGATVHRRAGPWTKAVHDLLRHLERVGFRGVPRVLGIDAQGQEILTYVPGEVAHPRVLHDTELRRVAELVRDYHISVSSFSPANDLSASERMELVHVAVERMRRMWQLLVDNADREPYATLLRDGHADFWKRVERHVSHQVRT